ncbi:MAG: hypothetical protein FD167_2541, partial [bacterium]
MREDLALSHLILMEARKLVAQAKEKKSNDLLTGLSKLISSLKVDYDHNQQIFIIQAQINKISAYLEVSKGEFQFYKRADLSANNSIVEKKPVDNIAQENAENARQLISKLLIQSQLDIKAFLSNNPAKNTPAHFNPASTTDQTAWLAVLAISLLSAFFTWYQATRTFNFLDNTYILEVSWRIANGEIPYKDFTLVLTPGTFLVQAFLIKFVSDHATIIVFWSMFAMVATILVTYKILTLISTPRWFAVLLCFIPAFGGNTVIPYVSYDVDTMLLCLCSIALLLMAEKREMPINWMLPVGFLATLPLMFKQNLGLAHLVMMLGMVNLSWFLMSWRFSFAKLILFHIGVLLGIALLIVPFWYFDALPALFQNTVLLPAKLRLQYTFLDLLLDYSPFYLHEKEPILVLVASLAIWGSFILGISF